MSNTVVPEIYAEVRDLMDEVEEKNHLTVLVHRKGSLRPTAEVEVLNQAAMPHMLHLADRARIFGGKQPVYLAETWRRLGADIVGVFPNLRTTVGIDYVATQLGSGSASTTTAHWIGLSNNTNAASAANTSGNTTNTRICWGTANSTPGSAGSTSTGEFTTTGVARSAATYAHTGGVASFSQTFTWTASGAVTGAVAAGLFDSATQGLGTLYLETTYTSTTLANTDQISIAWTINI